MAVQAITTLRALLQQKREDMAWSGAKRGGVKPGGSTWTRRCHAVSNALHESMVAPHRCLCGEMRKSSRVEVAFPCAWEIGFFLADARLTGRGTPPAPAHPLLSHV